MDNNHQKYDNISIVCNVGISVDEKTNENVLKTADEQLYIIPTIKTFIHRNFIGI